MADFGGNDGTAAGAFFTRSCVKPIVVDCEPDRLRYAESRGLPVRRAFLEDLSCFADKSVVWAFCSHTLEHTRDPEKALRELARVVSGGCYFVVPIEKYEHACHNHAHSIACETSRAWVRLFRRNGWRIVKGKEQMSRAVIMANEPTEYECLAEPIA